ncbi:YdbH domain-containing protein [Alcanivorax sp. JB21]|uniref:YdbH domain-containing protein n=1 Tax=Alcanivorax limicola TaxID=2874102 RepID=UPI001CBD5EEE|nr:YdbH domain-containing protein [Alcanivorax limicola]MBZ2189535.1 YdbH domain-containing protein [Alcanivorax limicola]
MPRTLHSIRRILPWLLIALLAFVLLLLMLAWLLWPASLRVEGVSWGRETGLQVQRLTWTEDGCQRLVGEQLRLSGIRSLTRPATGSLTATLETLVVTPCDAAGEMPGETPEKTPDGISLPRLPALTITIDALHLDTPATTDLPGIRVTGTQSAGHWTLDASQGRSHVAGALDAAGDWTLEAQLFLPDWHADLIGQLRLQGTGVLTEDAWRGALRLQGRELGHAAQPQRAAASAQWDIDQGDWSLLATLDAPLALTAGWHLQAHEALRARGDLTSVTALALNLTATGPQGEVALQLDTDAPDAASGAGTLRLRGPEMQSPEVESPETGAPDLHGEIPLTWEGQTLTLAPAAIHWGEALHLSWSAPLLIPLAAEGATTISAQLRYYDKKAGETYDDVRLETRDSRLSWTGGNWRWAGLLRLAGDYQGYAVNARWQGEVDPEGLSGAPLTAKVAGDDLALTITAPVTAMRSPEWATRASFSGHYLPDQPGAWPVSGTVSASQRSGDWRGVLAATSRLPFYDQGGEIAAQLPWRLGADASAGAQLFIDRGATLHISRGVISEGLEEAVLIRPQRYTANRALRLDATGIHGPIGVRAEGLTASRWVLPLVEGTLTLQGLGGEAALSVAAWQSALQLRARPHANGGVAGDIVLDTPLMADMSRGLPVTLTRGQLSAALDWHWQDALAANGWFRVNDLGVDMGGIVARGGAGRVALQLQEGDVRLTSDGPLRLATLDVGTTVRNIQTQVSTDLDSWQFSDIRAEVLGGEVLAPALHWPADDFQTVVITRIDMDRVAGMQADPVVQLAGRVGGYLPVQLGRNSLAVQGGRLANEEMLALMLLPGASVRAMRDANRAVQIAMDALSTLLINEFSARLDMTADGWLDAAVTIRGNNPQQRLPVVFNYTHKENILVLLRSLRIGDDIQRQVMDQQPVPGW